MKIRHTIYFIFVAIIGAIFYSSCAQEKADEAVPSSMSSIPDGQLYSMALGSGFTFYKNNPDTLPFTPGGGGHGGFVRIKFNAIAKSALGSDGKLPIGQIFPEGSFIVKEIYQQKGGLLFRIAVMYKTNKDLNQGSSWVWAEYNADGSNVSGVSNKGSACISCHSITASNSPVGGDQGNRDLVRFFGLH